MTRRRPARSAANRRFAARGPRRSRPAVLPSPGGVRPAGKPSRAAAAALPSLRERVDEAIAALRARRGEVGIRVAAPEIGVILGSGLDALADAVDVRAVVPYGEIPHFPVPAVEGHRGRLLLGRLEGRAVAVFQGRCHLYEGYTAEQVTFPVRVLRALGAHTLIVTNAAGGLNPGFRRGDLMLITDHINFTGTNPLTGPNDPALGPRFPDMSRVYDPGLLALARAAARAEGVPLRAGVYTGVLGPSYETAAEIKLLARWGSDAVGMSTVPEVIAARHGGLRVLGISAITDVIGAGAAAEDKVTHDAVLAAARGLAPRLMRLLRRVIREMPPRAG